MDKNYKLAALALFRELYNNNKDVYGVLSIFINHVIYKHKLISFSETEINGYLKEDFDFDIPDAVITQTIRKKISSDKDTFGRYFVKLNSQDTNSQHDISRQIQIYNDNTNSLINNIYQYFCAKNIDKMIDEKNIIKKLCLALYGLCLDRSYNDEYSSYVSSYIVDNQNNKEVQHALSEIKEGIILYSGLRWTSTKAIIGEWRSSLVIYLDTEILFSAYGYNGDLHKKLFDDFYGLVKEVNAKRGRISKDIITLKYFDYTRIDIDNYFNAATIIVEKGTSPIPGKHAMVDIIQDCEVKSDVEDKKIKFLSYLNKTLGIKEETGMSYYESQYNANNIDESSLTSYFQQKYPQYDLTDIANYIRMLNCVNICRKGVNNVNFDDCRFVLLTGKSAIINMVTDDKFKEIAPTYLATTIQYITNRIWFRLNKGFSSHQSLVSFDIVASAKILLSTQINNKIQASYQKLQKEVQDGNLSEEDIIERYTGYRQDTKSPEEVTATNVGDLLNDIISEDYFEKHIRKKELKDQEIKRLQRENKEKEKQLQEQDSHILILENNSINERNANNKKRIDTLSKLIYRTEVELKSCLQTKTKIEKKCENFISVLRVIKACFLVSLLIGIIFFIYRSGLSYVSTIFTIITFVVSLILMFYKRPQCISMTYLRKKREDKLIKKYNFNPQLEVDLRKEMEELNKEKDEIANLLS